MKRFHVHVAVPDLARSIQFYSAMFSAQPSVVSEEPAPSLASPASPRSEASGSPAPVRHAALGSADASSPPARKPAGKRAPAYDIVE